MHKYGAGAIHPKKPISTMPKTIKKLVVCCSKNITDPGIYKVGVYQNGYVIG